MKADGKTFELFDKVCVKTKNVIGFIVHIADGWYAVEKEGNEGPIYWNLQADDLELIED